MARLENDIAKIVGKMRDDAHAWVRRIIAEGGDEKEARAFGELVFDRNVANLMDALRKFGVGLAPAVGEKTH